MNISNNHLDTLTWTSGQRARLEKHQHIESIYQWDFLGKGSRERRGSRAIFLVTSVFKNEVEKKEEDPPNSSKIYWLEERRKFRNA